MSIESPCKVEFIPEDGDAVVLVDVGGWLASLPRFLPSQDLFETTGVKAGEAYFKPLGGVIVQIGFAVEEEFESYEEALDAFMAAEDAEGNELLKVTGALVITGATSVATYSPAAISGIKPTLPGDDGPVVIKAYQIQAALPVIEEIEE